MQKERIVYVNRDLCAWLGVRKKVRFKANLVESHFAVKFLERAEKSCQVAVFIDDDAVDLMEFR